jgi:hypothetical protein
MADNMVFQQLGVAPLAAAIVDATRRMVPQDQQTQVTYLDPEGTGLPVKIHGISLLPGESVDLADVLPEDQAKERAFKLSKNPFFKVSGGEDLQKQIDERAQNAAELEQKAHEAVQEARERAAEEQRTGKRPVVAGVPPEYIPPAESTFESPYTPPPVGSRPPPDSQTAIPMPPPAPSVEQQLADQARQEEERATAEREQKAREESEAKKAEEYRASIGEAPTPAVQHTGPEDGAEDDGFFDDEDELDDEPTPPPAKTATKTASKAKK